VIKNQTYTQPASHRAQLTEIASLNNSALQFLKRGGVILRHGARVAEEDLYRAYRMYCRVVAHTQPMALVRFRSVVGALGLELGFGVSAAPNAHGIETGYFEGIELAQAKVLKLMLV